MKHLDKKQKINNAQVEAEITVDKSLNNYRMITAKAKMDHANFVVSRLDMHQLNELVLKDKAGRR